eukprot:Gb_36655 [translate_table: standard]
MSWAMAINDWLRHTLDGRVCNIGMLTCIAILIITFLTLLLRRRRHRSQTPGEVNPSDPLEDPQAEAVSGDKRRIREPAPHDQHPVDLNAPENHRGLQDDAIILYHEKEPEFPWQSEINGTPEQHKNGLISPLKQQFNGEIGLANDELMPHGSHEASIPDANGNGTCDRPENNYISSVDIAEPIIYVSRNGRIGKHVKRAVTVLQRALGNHDHDQKKRNGGGVFLMALGNTAISKAKQVVTEVMEKVPHCCAGEPSISVSPSKEFNRPGIEDFSIRLFVQEPAEMLDECKKREKKKKKNMKLKSNIITIYFIKKWRRKKEQILRKIRRMNQRKRITTAATSMEKPQLVQANAIAMDNPQGSATFISRPEQPQEHTDISELRSACISDLGETSTPANIMEQSGGQTPSSFVSEPEELIFGRWPRSTSSSQPSETPPVQEDPNEGADDASCVLRYLFFEQRSLDLESIGFVFPKS